MTEFPARGVRCLETRSGSCVGNRGVDHGDMAVRADVDACSKSTDTPCEDEPCDCYSVTARQHLDDASPALSIEDDLSIMDCADGNGLGDVQYGHTHSHVRTANEH